MYFNEIEKDKFLCMERTSTFLGRSLKFSKLHENVFLMLIGRAKAPAVSCLHVVKSTAIDHYNKLRCDLSISMKNLSKFGHHFPKSKTRPN